MGESEHLFVYGTLQPGMAPDYLAPAVNMLRFVGAGSVAGVLYDLGDYPGVVLEPGAVLGADLSRRVYGKVFRLPEGGDVLGQLDTYEDFDPGSPEESLYVRVLQPVELEDGGSVVCWIYVYNRPTEGLRVIGSGRF